MTTGIVTAAVLALFTNTPALAAQDALQEQVDATVLPTLKAQNIPGMAVAVISEGKPHYFYYGLASKDALEPLNRNTLFELGSISKTYTATLATYAQAQGKLKLNAPASHYLPALKGTAFDNISVLNLGTYTAGGLPLQFPEASDSQDKMLDYYITWKPRYTIGERRQYSNPSLGLFGYLAAQSLGKPFDELMEGTLFSGLGLKSSYINVPREAKGVYAQGYTRADQPSRLQGGAMDAEAYGVRSNLEDMARFVQLNIQAGELSAPLQRAIEATHIGYYRVGDMSQGLGWESYAWPLPLAHLLAGNSAQMINQAQPAQWFNPPQTPQGAVLFNKTGSTSGFGSYVAFIPAKGLGVVLLANKNYPNEERIRMAYEILGTLDR
jgi:beta-lactamase class C